MKRPCPYLLADYFLVCLLFALVLAAYSIVFLVYSDLLDIQAHRLQKQHYRRYRSNDGAPH